jgi:undecaprenyl-phosphate 4-deoxy-4-formamido-L-arabinose transferase
MELSVVIPVYNSAETLPTLLARLLSVLDDLQVTSEIVFVDDGSRDGSWEVLQSLQAEHSDRIICVQLMRNFGQHNALMCGFRHTQGRFVVTMDDDLQNPPEEIAKLLTAIRSQPLDVVYGAADRRKHRAWRNLGSWLVNLVYRTMFKTHVSISSFRIIRREVLEATFSYSLNYTFVDGLLAWNSQRISEITVEHHPRQRGRSNYSIAKLVVLALNLFSNFSLLPLQAVSLLGFVIAVSGLLAGGYYLVQYLLSNVVVSGYASTIVSILVLGGAQLLSLGVIGEYLGRLHLNVNRKPQYTIRQVCASRIHNERGWQNPGASEELASLPSAEELEGIH